MEDCSNNLSLRVTIPSVSSRNFLLIDGRTLNSLCRISMNIFEVITPVKNCYQQLPQMIFPLLHCRYLTLSCLQKWHFRLRYLPFAVHSLATVHGKNSKRFSKHFSPKLFQGCIKFVGQKKFVTRNVIKMFRHWRSLNGKFRFCLFLNWFFFFFFTGILDKKKRFTYFNDRFIVVYKWPAVSGIIIDWLTCSKYFSSLSLLGVKFKRLFQDIFLNSYNFCRW